ncbi:MAG: hypothetical protein NT138_00145 [Planctomycetales bacterium]|nr:hypothetical protein [Planctomycetales bacterium]
MTWSIVADGTDIPASGEIPGESSNPSNLVAFLSAFYGTVTADTNYTDEVWFPHFSSTFERWSELSGLTFVYVPYDDGISLAGPSGVLGVRADVRIGGHAIDGNSGVLGYSSFPNYGEMVLDTADTSYLSAGNAISPADCQNILELLFEFSAQCGLDWEVVGLSRVISQSAVVLQIFMSELVARSSVFRPIFRCPGRLRHSRVS